MGSFCAYLSARLFLLLILGKHGQSINKTIPFYSLYEERDSSLTYTKLHKCSCGASQVLIEGSCQDNETYVTALIDERSAVTEVVNTAMIKEVVVEPLNCPPNHLNLSLPVDSFALKTSGDLFNVNYGLNLPFSKYCVEHFVNEQKDIVSEAYLCLPVPKVPKCCPEEFYDSSTNKCTTANDTDVAINFMLGKRSFQMIAHTFLNVLACKEHENLTTIPLMSSLNVAQFKLTNEGLILAHTVSLIGERIFIPSPQYCVNVDSEEVATFASYCHVDPLFSHSKMCKDTTCIRKCCFADEIFDMNNLKCVPATRDKQWTPKFYDFPSLEEIQEPDHKTVIGFPLNCEFFGLRPTNDPPDRFKLLGNGSLFVENWELSLPSHKYCIDNFKYETEVLEESIVCFIESPEASSGCKGVGTVLYPVLLLISCVFLAVTLVVYALIPDLHCKVQGKCLIASVSSLLSAYICLVIVQLAYFRLTENGCVIFGLLTQFSLLASFFWLNVMSFDIWRTLRSMQSGRESPSGARRRYLLYSAYAWGCPLLIVLVTSVMQFLPESVDTTRLILPGFGESNCFLPPDNKVGLWLYFYGFISVILAVNTGFFLHLAFILVKARKVSEFALGKKNQLQKEWAKLYLKLFLIMGISWIFEVVSWIEGSCGFWIVTDIINSLRGLLIFVIFVCKKDVIKKLLSESSPAFHRMRTTMRQSSSFFSRSSKRTSNFYVDPSSTEGGNDVNSTPNHGDTTL